MEELATVSNAVDCTSVTTISPYEWWSLIIAALAVLISICSIIIPLLIKKFRRLKIDIIPFEQTPITFLFGNVGSYIKLRFCLECKNQDSTIKKIHAKIIRNSDNKFCEFDWFSLDSIYINWFGANVQNRINSLSLARPLKINADTLEPFIIEFTGNGNEKLKDFCIECNQSIQNFLQSLQSNNEQLQNMTDICNKFKETDSSYPQLISTLQNYYFWKSGTYSIIITILHDCSKSTTKTFNFTLTTDDENALRKNIELTVLENLYKAYQLVPPFNSINKILS